MNACNVVTVCSSDAGRFNVWKNSFIPDRRSMVKQSRSAASRIRSRTQSVSFSSVLRPVLYSEFRENFPTIMMQKNDYNVPRNGSVDSDVLRREINSAVLLLEQRNEMDLVPRNHKKHSPEGSPNDCHYKVYDRSRLSQSAQRAIEQRVCKDVPRWKSARTVDRRHTKNDSKKYSLKMLSSEDTPSPITKMCSSKSIAREQRYKENQKNFEPNLIISSSNSLTNFITIDDIAGVRESWTHVEQKTPLTKKTSKPVLNMSMEKEPSPKHRSREHVLRDYMDVYMHWRTINAIEEHRELVCQKSQENKFAKIRCATPKQRLELFKKVVNDGQSPVQKGIKCSGITVKRESSPTNVKMKCDSDHVDPFTPMERWQDVGIETVAERTIKADVEEVVKGFEIEEDPKSEVYSEIDWLECEDIY